jgi:hypothetical protein
VGRPRSEQRNRFDGEIDALLIMNVLGLTDAEQGEDAGDQSAHPRTRDT